MTKEEKELKLESVKLIKYSGNGERWREWHKKVLAYAATKNFLKALTKPQDAEVTEKMKSDALNFLTMSLSLETLFLLWKMQIQQQKFGKN